MAEEPLQQRLPVPRLCRKAVVAPAAIGSIETIGAVAGILGAVAAPSLIKRVPAGLLTISTSALLAVAIIPMAFTDNVLAIGALLGIGLFGNPAGNAAISSYMAASTPDRLQGRANAALGFGTGALMPLAPLAGGFLLAVWGGERAMLVMAALTALSLLPLVCSREVRQLPTPDRWPTADQDAAATDEDGPAADAGAVAILAE